MTRSGDQSERESGDPSELEFLRERVRELEAHADERVRMEDALRGVATSTGAGSFEALVRGLSHALVADFVSVSEFDVDSGRMRTHAFFADGALAENFEYELAGTPCENVVGREFYVCPHDVRARFPDDVWLVENGIESYVGTPLFDRDGRPLGNIAILSRQRARDVPLAQSLLRSCAVRASAEIERLATERDLRRAEDELRQAQKLEAIGQLAGGVAHDFNNLLCVILGRAEILERKLAARPELASEVSVIREAGERAAALTKQLLAFGRKQIARPTVLDLNAIVGSMDVILQRLVGESIELRLYPASDLARVFVDRSRIEQVVLNLAVNARDAMPSGGKLTIETTNVHIGEAHALLRPDMKPGPYVMLAVTDTGVGMPEDTLAHVFEPFFTTKAEGRGTGLGLATVFGIVKQAGGRIAVYTEPGHGSAFKIYLPAADHESADSAECESADPGSRGTSDLTPSAQDANSPTLALGGPETILVVEDDDLVRGLARSVLEDRGYRVLCASGSDEAVGFADEHVGAIDLVITDVVLRGATGPSVYARVAERRPSAEVLFVSAYADNALVHQGVLARGSAFLQKPFGAEALAAKVRRVLDRRDAR